MLMTAWNGYEGFTVIDDATAKEVPQVSWVDDSTLQYGVLRIPVTYDPVTWDAIVDVVQVTRVAVNFAAREIHVNEPPSIVAGITLRELHACSNCRQHETCRRIDYCPAHKTAFGEACQP